MLSASGPPGGATVVHAGCDWRLADLVNEVEAGQVLVELKYPRCQPSASAPAFKRRIPLDARGLET